jgi:hypothetical protein
MSATPESRERVQSAIFPTLPWQGRYRAAATSGGSLHSMHVSASSVL